MNYITIILIFISSIVIGQENNYQWSMRVQYDGTKEALLGIEGFKVFKHGTSFISETGVYYKTYNQFSTFYRFGFEFEINTQLKSNYRNIFSVNTQGELWLGTNIEFKLKLKKENLNLIGGYYYRHFNLFKNNNASINYQQIYLGTNYIIN